METVVRETVAVARAAGVAIDADKLVTATWKVAASMPEQFSSTAQDMARFLVAQLNGGATPSGRALSAASVATMQAQHFTGDSVVPGMSYAFFNQSELGHRQLQVTMKVGNVPDAVVTNGMRLFKERVLPEIADL